MSDTKTNNKKTSAKKAKTEKKNPGDYCSGYYAWLHKNGLGDITKLYSEHCLDNIATRPNSSMIFPGKSDMEKIMKMKSQEQFQMLKDIIISKKVSDEKTSYFTMGSSGVEIKDKKINGETIKKIEEINSGKNSIIYVDKLPKFIVKGGDDINMDDLQKMIDEMNGGKKTRRAPRKSKKNKVKNEVKNKVKNEVKNEVKKGGVLPTLYTKFSPMVYYNDALKYRNLNDMYVKKWIQSIYGKTLGQNMHEYFNADFWQYLVNPNGYSKFYNQYYNPSSKVILLGGGEDNEEKEISIKDKKLVAPETMQEFAKGLLKIRNAKIVGGERLFKHDGRLQNSIAMNTILQYPFNYPYSIIRKPALYDFIRSPYFLNPSVSYINQLYKTISPSSSILLFGGEIEQPMTINLGGCGEKTAGDITAGDQYKYKYTAWDTDYGQLRDYYEKYYPDNLKNTSYTSLDKNIKVAVNTESIKNELIKLIGTYNKDIDLQPIIGKISNLVDNMIKNIDDKNKINEVLKGVKELNITNDDGKNTIIAADILAFAKKTMETSKATIKEIVKKVAEEVMAKVAI